MSEYEEWEEDWEDTEGQDIHCWRSRAEAEFWDWLDRMRLSGTAEGRTEMDRNTVRSVFRQLGLHWQESSTQPGATLFCMNFDSEDRSFHLEVRLEAEAGMCRISAEYPFRVEAQYLLPLYAQLAKLNASQTWGSYCYDPLTDTIGMVCRLPIRSGLDREDFREVFLGMLAAASFGYEPLKRCADGKFRPRDRARFICMAQELLIRLSRCGQT